VKKKRTEDPLPAGDLESSLGYRFRRRELLEAALTHRSFAHETGLGESDHYERLEFLGDALIGFVVSEWLLRDDPAADEGTLTRRKQSVVRMEALAEAASRLDLGRHLRLGRGEETTGGRGKRSLLADAFEAVAGAVFLDGGVRAARAFVLRHLGGELRAHRKTLVSPEDYKTYLQEFAQARWREAPRYRIVSTTGPAHALEFEAEVRLRGELVGRGRGPSRKQAEQAAARQALEALGERGERRRRT
jgi:ribonuclease-3